MEELINAVLNPPLPKEVDAYYENLLNTSGMLFGLAFAGLLFVIQSGFSSFKFSRRMFLEVYVRFGRGLLVSLAYLTVLPFAMLHFPYFPRIYTVAYIFFAFVYGKAVLDHLRQLGYIHTLSTPAFVPQSFGALRAYFRFITNIGWPVRLVGLPLLLLLLVYPLLISLASGSWTITEQGFVYSSVVLLLHAVARITSFIPEFFKMSNLELESARIPEEASQEYGVKIDYRIERKTLRKFLEIRGVAELDHSKPKIFLDGDATLELLVDRDGPEAWFNATVSVKNPPREELHGELCCYAIQILGLCAESTVDINEFVISINVHIHGRDGQLNMFFRTNRAELDTVFTKGQDAVTRVRSLRNTLFDEIFRDL
ncbi:hypothetical protein [Rosistilla oblonga]|uniref:hypothetical protein n=1 Tax=Rosistilla oblonga TaxID=2527990 RepID=UPI003A973EA2